MSSLMWRVGAVQDRGGVLLNGSALTRPALFASDREARGGPD
jgi:hypothetical protein